MKTGMRTLAVAVSLLMLMTGPLAPIAFAQQPSPVQAEPPAQQQPTPQPEPPAQQQPTPQPGPAAQQQPTPQPEPAAQPPAQQGMPEPLREARHAEAAHLHPRPRIADVVTLAS